MLLASVAPGSPEVLIGWWIEFRGHSRGDKMGSPGFMGGRQGRDSALWSPAGPRGMSRRARSVSSSWSHPLFGSVQRAPRSSGSVSPSSTSADACPLRPEVSPGRLSLIQMALNSGLSVSYAVPGSWGRAAQRCLAFSPAVGSPNRPRGPHRSRVCVPRRGACSRCSQTVTLTAPWEADATLRSLCETLSELPRVSG